MKLNIEDIMKDYNNEIQEIVKSGKCAHGSHSYIGNDYDGEHIYKCSWCNVKFTKNKYDDYILI